VRSARALALAALLLALPAAPSSARSDARHDLDLPRVARLLAPPASLTAGDGPAAAEFRRRYPWRIPRATENRPDAGGPLVHVVYLTTKNQPAPALDRLGILEDSVRSQDAWLSEQAGLRWRLDVFSFRAPHRRRPVRAIDVTFVDSGARSEDLTTLADVEAVLTAHGLSDPEKRYLVYAATDAGSVCGEGDYPLSDDPNEVGRYSAVYLYSDEGCGGLDLAPDRRTPSWAESIAQQELMHNDGAVPLAAPHDCKPAATGHVCTPALVSLGGDPEMEDVMFPYASGPLAAKVLDRGRDDYFKHGLPLRDLADSPYLLVAGRP